MPFAFSELLIIAVVVMALFGSRKIPRMLGDLGRSLGSLKKEQAGRKDAAFLDETEGRAGRRQDGGRRG